MSSMTISIRYQQLQYIGIAALVMIFTALPICCTAYATQITPLLLTEDTETDTTSTEEDSDTEESCPCELED